jgi:hypothetical protein
LITIEELSAMMTFVERLPEIVAFDAAASVNIVTFIYI